MIVDPHQVVKRIIARSDQFRNADSLSTVYQLVSSIATVFVELLTELTHNAIQEADTGLIERASVLLAEEVVRRESLEPPGAPHELSSTTAPQCRECNGRGKVHSMARGWNHGLSDNIRVHEGFKICDHCAGSGRCAEGC